jgi:hypothetical protein
MNRTEWNSSTQVVVVQQENFEHWKISKIEWNIPGEHVFLQIDCPKGGGSVTPAIKQDVQTTFESIVRQNYKTKRRKGKKTLWQGTLQGVMTDVNIFQILKVR